MQCHPYRFALVLEDEDVLYVLKGPELSVTVGPDLDEFAYTLLRQPGQGLLVLVGVDHDLTDALPGRRRREDGAGLIRLGRVRDEGGELVLEDDYIVRSAGYLGRKSARLRRAQGTVLGRREEGAVLAVGGVGGPLAQGRVPPELVQSSSPSKEDYVAAVVFRLALPFRPRFLARSSSFRAFRLFVLHPRVLSGTGVLAAKSVAPNDLRVPAGAHLRYAPLRRVVHVDYAKPLRVPLRPLKVVQERPDEVPLEVYAPFYGLARRS